MINDKPTATLDTSQVATTGAAATGPASNPTDPPQASAPPFTSTSTSTAGIAGQAPETKTEEKLAEGVAQEKVVWEGRYSLKNFLGRLILRTVLSLAWVVLAVYTWGEGHPRWQIPTALLGIALAVAWAVLFIRMAQARLGHSYQLTTRRLFVSTGLFRRRRDQLELLRAKDVYLRQGLLERWLSIGTVVVISSEEHLPTFYLAGIDDPKRVMDLVWRCARAEREGKTVQVENL